MTEISSAHKSNGPQKKRTRINEWVADIVDAVISADGGWVEHTLDESEGGPKNRHAQLQSAVGIRFVEIAIRDRTVYMRMRNR